MSSNNQDRDFSVQVFRDQFLQRVGFIEGRESEPIQLLYILGSWYGHAEWLKGFGSKSDHETLLGQWVPAGLQLIFDHDNAKLLRVERLQPEAVSPRENWLIFPSTFQDRPVHYRRFYMSGIPELA